MNTPPTQIYSKQEPNHTPTQSFEAIPAEMKAFRSWVVWKEEVREDKPTKVPYIPGTGYKASHSDSRTWRTFEEAVAAFENGGYGGIGYVFSSGDPYCGIDLDNCRNPETGALASWAAQIVAKLGGYAEASPSGSGVHVIVKGRLPDGVRNRVKGSATNGRIEAYDERRFLTMSGRAL